MIQVKPEFRLCNLPAKKVELLEEVYKIPETQKIIQSIQPRGEFVLQQEDAMNSSASKQDQVSSIKSRPLKEKLWNLFGILFYITVAVVAIYHLIPYIKPWFLEKIQPLHAIIPRYGVSNFSPI